MKKILMYILLPLLLIPYISCGEKKDGADSGAQQPLHISVLKRVSSGLDSKAFIRVDTVEIWKPSETAVIISDMWDKHWCPTATARVAELAPVMNDVLSSIRSKGVIIVHAPSELMDYYKDYPGRKAAMKYSGESLKEFTNGVEKLPSEAGAAWPIDAVDEGCEDIGPTPERVWTKQIDAVKIEDGDFISADGAQIGEYFRDKGIKNVIMMGVHTNMCVMHRTYGLRTMKRLGFNLVLMRDMTDLMYNPKTYPYTSHWDGLNRMIEYIEKYVCPTITSSDFTGKEPFVFSEAKAEANSKK